MSLAFTSRTERERTVLKADFQSRTLPQIPAKRYFTIGEVSELCGVKPHVLRYWEQEFTQLKPVKRRGNRRYYQHHEVLLIRRIRELLYEQGFTISGARNRLDARAEQGAHEDAGIARVASGHASSPPRAEQSSGRIRADGKLALDAEDAAFLRRELAEIATLLRH